MALTPEETRSNASILSKVFMAEASGAGEDPAQQNGIHEEIIRRAKASMDYALKSEIQRGDVLLFSVNIESPDGQVRAPELNLSRRPTNHALMIYLGTVCREGDRVLTSTTFVGGKVDVNDTWPISLEDAQDMVDATALLSADSSEASGDANIRDLGSSGKIVRIVSESKEYYRFPKLQGRNEVHDGKIYVVFTLNFRSKTRVFSWISQA